MFHSTLHRGYLRVLMSIIAMATSILLVRVLLLSFPKIAEFMPYADFIVSHQVQIAALILLLVTPLLMFF